MHLSFISHTHREGYRMCRSVDVVRICRVDWTSLCWTVTFNTPLLHSMVPVSNILFEQTISAIRGIPIDFILPTADISLSELLGFVRCFFVCVVVVASRVISNIPFYWQSIFDSAPLHFWCLGSVCITFIKFNKIVLLTNSNACAQRSSKSDEEQGRNMLMLFAFDLFCLPKNDNSMD